MKLLWSGKDILIAPLLKVEYILSSPTSATYTSPELRLQFLHPDRNVEQHCILQHGQKTLYNPVQNANETARAAEDLLETAVARYAEDNLLVVRVRKP